MSTIKHISIPKPCHEQWQQMTTVSDGRYCGHCCKTVVDFNAMSNQQIVTYLNINNNACGRIDPQRITQLNNLSKGDERKRNAIKRLLVAASLMSILPFFKAEAKPLHKMEQVEPDFNSGQSNMPADTIKRITLKGQIIGDDNLPLPGATLQLKGTETGTTANTDGYFELKDVPVSGVIVAHFIGFQTTELPVANFRDSNAIFKLKMQPNIMGAIVVIKRNSFPKKVWNTIKSIF
ncbi:carboxypeptidase-like regulatory domain-containing protein [Mucilaginibacter angelicae]|uniref:Carboxypeptidase-like regulatory domain-containing protein n=1 Tax=Mucilaginibacter angelicae TaxID=869718 RepID=A0ABV6LAS9_9SPHI